MHHSTDPKGRLFIDRDPELFAVLLQFLRAHTLPPQSYVKTHRQALLEECKFFQITHLEHYLCGYTSKFDLRLEDRQIKERESDVRSTCEDRSFLLNVFETCTLPRAANELEEAKQKACSSELQLRHVLLSVPCVDARLG